MTKINNCNVENIQQGIKRGIDEVRNILCDINDEEIKTALEKELSYYQNS